MSGLENPWGLYFLAILIPVIILYLLKPKPKELKIPSLMFIKEIETHKRFSSFLRKFMRDPLLLLQLLILTLLVVTISNPYYLTSEKVEINEDIVLVIDSSASMQAGSPSGFVRAKDYAYSIASDMGQEDRMSIILAENIPVIILKDGNRQAALATVDKLNQMATQSGVGGAIRLASDLLDESTVSKKIYVISDFSRFIGEDPRSTQKIASSKGISTEFIDVNGKFSDNVAITAFEVGRLGVTCYAESLVKNYGEGKKDIELTLYINDKIAYAEPATIEGMSSKIFRLSAACSGSKQKMSVALSPKDALDIDNHAYGSIAESLDLDVLLIKNEDDNENIKYALETLDGVSVSETHPPIFPQSFDAYDMIIFQSADEGKILDGVFRDIGKSVEKGTSLVVIGFEGLLEAPAGELKGLLPVELVGIGEREETPSKLLEHQLFQNVDIGTIRAGKYLQAIEEKNSIVLAKIQDFSAVSTWDVGLGEVVYVGLNVDSDWSDFSLQPSFPIFWNNLIHWTNREGASADKLNFKTGDRVPMKGNDTRIIKPSGAVVSGSGLIFDEAGFYTTKDGLVIAASVIDEKESDITYHMSMENIDVQGEYLSKKTIEEQKHELFWIFALASLLLLLGEWAYVKRRGSLFKR